jgi:hypothetical protein
MKRNAVTGALCALMFAATGCTEDVGDCFQDGPAGLDTVLRGGHIEYGGQAIMNTACATGCHSSKAKGKDRYGAPGDLNFDLEPVASTSSAKTEQNENGRTYAVLSDEQINGLRERQRIVFSKRNLIWTQVREGLMPPDGKFAAFKKAVQSIFDSKEETPCTRGSALGDVESKATQDVLRNWLACQAPIVESYGGPVEANGVAGTAGYQYLSCSASPQGDGGAGDGGGGGTVTFDDIYMDVIQGAGCTACHPALDPEHDFSTADKAYAALVEDKGSQCGSKPYVKVKDPANSFLIDLVTLDTPCPSDKSIQRMPVGGELSADQVQELRDWINGGALRSSAFIHAPSLAGGLDGGAAR